ncbi:MAG TPA: hypothetical protein VE843_12250, partial [Ktedonobacteraceae bacterium]|nr:hypothetical protein [Ktedonobacteraceae bacterium]
MLISTFSLCLLLEQMSIEKDWIFIDLSLAAFGGGTKGKELFRGHSEPRQRALPSALPLPFFRSVVRIVIYMMNIASTNSSMLNQDQNRIGVLNDTEVLLVDVVQGKRVLRSNLLPLDAHTLSVLL